MANEVPVPHSFIPKPLVTCTECHGKVKTVMGVAFTDGYHRRHVCQSCGYKFYTLASYDDDGFQAQPRPFKDRPLTKDDEDERLRWWEHELNNTVVNVRDPFIERLQAAFWKKESQRTHTEQFMVELLGTMRAEAETLDDMALKEKAKHATHTPSSFDDGVTTEGNENDDEEQHT